jgi:hypothetical protein
MSRSNPTLSFIIAASYANERSSFVEAKVSIRPQNASSSWVKSIKTFAACLALFLRGTAHSPAKMVEGGRYRAQRGWNGVGDKQHRRAVQVAATLSAIGGRKGLETAASDTPDHPGIRRDLQTRIASHQCVRGGDVAPRLSTSLP